MTFLGFRLKKIEDRIAPSIRESFVIVIGGMEADSEGNYTVPHIDVPGAEVITIEASPETMKWLAEQEVKRKQADEEAEMRRKLAEIGNADDEDPALQDYDTSQGVKLPEEYVAPKPGTTSEEKPGPQLVYFKIGQTKYVRDGLQVHPVNDSKVDPPPETISEWLARSKF
jgi:hypothetical protein